MAVNLLQEASQLRQLDLLLKHLVDLFTQTASSHPQMGLQNLTHVHPRGHTERVQNDINRITVLVIRHVLHGHDDRNDTLVTVSARHFVTGLNAPLHREVNLSDLQYARCQIVAALQLLLFNLETLFELLVLLLQQSLGRDQLAIEIGIRQFELEPLLTLQLCQHCLSQLGAFAEATTRHRGLPIQQAGQTGECRFFVDPILFAKILAIVG